MPTPRKLTEGFRVISTRLFLKHRPRRDRHVLKGQYTAIEAFLSMHLDMHTHGRLLSERAYSRTWRRTRRWVHARMEEFRADPVYQQQGDQLGLQVGDHGGDQIGDQTGDHLSAAETTASGNSGSQIGHHIGDQPGDQPGDQTGATTLRREERRQRESAASAGDGRGRMTSLSELVPLVMKERSDWTPEQAEAWAKANLPRLEDEVDAYAPKDRGAALRGKVRRWARAERETPRGDGHGPPKTARQRVLAHLRNAYPDLEHVTEEHVEAHWRQFGPQLDWPPYQAPGDTA